MKTIAITNQKGGVGKTTTALNLGTALTKMGHKVLLIDADPQGNLSYMSGFQRTDDEEKTLADAMGKVIAGEEVDLTNYICSTSPGPDIVLSNIELSTTELMLVNAMSRETVLKTLLYDIDKLRRYDYVLIDCMPSLSVLTLNALVAANSVIIPLQPAFLSIKGISQLLKNIAQVKKRLNPTLSIAGLLITMADMRTRVGKDIMNQIQTLSDENIPVFNTVIPVSTKVVESSGRATSLFEHDPKGRATSAYSNLAEEISA